MALRKLHNLTQEDIAEVLDISVSYYGQIERGEKALTLNVVIVLAQKYHTCIDDIIWGRSAIRSADRVDFIAARDALNAIIDNAN